ncbi:hypothetical protein ACWCQN_24355 [Streptomyces sp. NPDC001984]
MEPEIHTPQPIVHIAQAPLAATQYAAPVVVHQGAPAAVQSVLLPDGRVVTGYAITQPPAPAAPVAQPTARVSPVAVNVALGGVGFLAVCGGLLLLTSFIAALAALIQQLIILAAVIFGGFIALQVFGHRGGDGTTVNIRKAVFKRNHFHG